MKKRFTAFLVALFLMLPQAFITAEAFENTLNPFDELDDLRREALNTSNKSMSEAESDGKSRTKKTAAQKNYLSSVNGISEEKGKSYIVKFKENVSLGDIYAIIKDRNYVLLADSESRLFRICVDDYSEFTDKYKDSISYINEDLIRKAAAVTNDPYLSDSWAYDKMDVYKAWDYTTGKTAVSVAVLDTGIERRHEDFTGTNILRGYDTVTQKASVATDTNGHGTEICGLIAAAANNGKGSAGVAYGVSIMPVRVSTTATTIYASNLIMGIRFAVDAGAKIINMSCGSYSSSDAEREAVNYALQKGCILVASSGNDGELSSGTDKMYPASYEGVISVASVNKESGVSSFSQHNDCVDVAAPGENIFVMKYTDGKSGYMHQNGTSYSSAYVSGIAALAASYLNASVRFGSEEFMSLIRDTAGGKRSDYYGYGIINAAKILSTVNRPIVTGVSDGETYYSNVTINFNRGSANLDGVQIHNGEIVYENGSHTLYISEGEYSKTIRFSVDNSPLSYEYTEESNYAVFTFRRGSATLDGFPYASGQHIISSGEHTFELSGEFSNTIIKKINLGFDLPYVTGVSDNGSYDTAVCIRVTGTGTATLDGSAFTGETIVSTGGKHKLVVFSGNKNRSKTYNFTIQNGTSSTFQSDLVNAKAIVDSANGYIILYSPNIQGIRVYDINNPSANKRYLNIGKANGYAFYGDYLLIFHDFSITKLNRSRILNQSNPVEGVTDMGEKISACVLYGSQIYYVNQSNLKRYDIVTGEKAGVSQLTVNADKAFMSSDGAYLYLLCSSENSRTVNIFDRNTGTVTEKILPVNTLDESIVFGNSMLAVGSSIFSGDGFERISENSSDKCVLISGNLLFTDRYIINASTNKYLAVFREQVSDIVIGSNNGSGDDSKTSEEYIETESYQAGVAAGSFDGNTVYVFYTDGSIDIIKNNSNPVMNFSPSKFKAAAYSDIISGVSVENTPYDSFSDVYSGRKVTSLDSDGNRLYIICDGIPMLYVLDAVTLAQTDAVQLRYIPRQVVVSQEKLYISFRNQGSLYTAATQSAGNGKYMNIGYTPQGFSVENNKLSAIKESMVTVTDLDTLRSVDTGIPANGVRISGDKIITSSSSILNIYNTETFALEGSISTGANITSFMINGDYAITGGRIFSIYQRKLLYNTKDTILAQRGNTAITSNGVYSLSEDTFISSYKVNGSLFYLSPSYSFYFIKDNRIIRAKSANGGDLTEMPLITGIEQNGNYTKGVTIGYSYGIGYVDAQRADNGSYYSNGGDHRFVLMLSCGISKSIKFYITPVISGIRIVGGDRSINVGDKINLSVQFVPAGTPSTDVVFETEDSDIVKVTRDGTVTGLKEGVAVVKAKTVQGGFYNECIITVSKMLLEFKKDSGYLTDRNNVLVTGIALGTFADDIIKAVHAEGVAEIVDKNGKRAEGAAGTGMFIILRNSSGQELDKLALSVTGDISGDGYLSADDCYCLAEILEDTGDYGIAFLKAADIDRNGVINNADMSAMKAQLLYNGNSLVIKNTPPVSNDISIAALVKTNIYDGEKVIVTVQLENALGVYAVSGRLNFNKSLLTYSNFVRQSWNDIVYEGDGFVSFISNSRQKEGSKRSSKTLLSFEFTLKKGALGKQILFEAADTIAVCKGVSYTLPKSQTLRRVEKLTYGNFGIKINNTKNFTFSPDVYKYDITVGSDEAFLDIDTEYPEDGRVIISDTVIPDNNFLEVDVVYIDPEGESYTYVINVTREAEYIPDSNCNLESLSVEGFELSFNKSSTEYTLTVPYETEKLRLNYKAESDLCRVDVSNPGLNVGENLVKLTCIAESGEMRIYTITVTREEKSAESEDSGDKTGILKDPMFYAAVTLGLVSAAVAVILIKKKKIKLQ